MAASKTSTLTLRIAPLLKEALHTAASREHRSIANMAEWLILDYYGRHGIVIPDKDALLDKRRKPHSRSLKLVKPNPVPWGGDATARPPEKRRDRRIDIALPVILENATGVTRNVSSSGVFFWISGTYALGDVINFAMGRRTESGEFMLKCRGVVFRTEQRGNDVGVAVRVAKTATGGIHETRIAANRIAVGV
jgi:hypothetical protein